MFDKDEFITCTVVSNGKVYFNDQIMSSSEAAIIPVRSLGYNWSVINGNEHWKYDGETLTARLFRMEDEQE